MSRPCENRVRRVIHILPVTDTQLQKLAEKHGTLGRAIDAAIGVSSAGRAAGAGVGRKRPASKRKGDEQ
jgi:hypothetical protein